MKVIIAGGGIAGLSLYHGLSKVLKDSDNTWDIHIYEARDSDRLNSAAALGLAPNGLRSLARLSPQGVEQIVQRGFACPIFTFRNTQGQSLRITCLYSSRH